MTSFRAVRPNRAWDARSSSPMYASSSTIRPTRRPSPSSWTSRHPSSAVATSIVGSARSRSGAGGRVTTATGVAGSARDEDVEPLEPDRDQQPEDRDEPGDQARPVQVGEAGCVHDVEEVADPGELVVALQDSRDHEERVEDEDDAANQEQCLHDPEQPADDLVGE